MSLSKNTKIYPLNMETSVQPLKKKQRTKIPKALREQVWLRYMGAIFEGKCSTTWCQNKITVFNFESGHDIPESKGGPTTIENLIPLCSNCNKSMSNQYTFNQWCSTHSNKKISEKKLRGFFRFFSCFYKTTTN